MDRAEGLRDGAVTVICLAWAHKHEWEQRQLVLLTQSKLMGAWGRIPGRTERAW